MTQPVFFKHFRQDKIKNECLGYTRHIPNVKVTPIPLLWPQWLLHTSAEVQRP